MILRPFWLSQLEKAWKKRPLIWLSGARRSGKTTLCKMVTDAVYLNYDMRSVSRQLENPEYFYRNLCFSPQIGSPYKLRFGELEVEFCSVLQDQDT